MDVCDQAFEEQEGRIASITTSNNMGKTRYIKATGFCHNRACGEEVEGDKLFCNSSCAEEYERQNDRLGLKFN